MATDDKLDLQPVSAEAHGQFIHVPSLMSGVCPQWRYPPLLLQDLNQMGIWVFCLESLVLKLGLGLDTQHISMDSMCYNTPRNVLITKL